MQHLADFSDLVPTILNDENKKLNEQVKQRQEELIAVSAKHADLTERSAIIQKHLANVISQSKETQGIVDAKEQAIRSEEHFTKLSERQIGRAAKEIADLEKQVKEYEERNQIFRGKDALDTLKNQLRLNQEEMDQWAAANRQKEARPSPSPPRPTSHPAVCIRHADNLVVERYARADEQKVRELALTQERLTKEVQEKKRALDTEVTETQAAQIELDKTAEDFKNLHRRREELIAQWEASLAAMRQRDAAIRANRETYATGKQRLGDFERQLAEQRKMLEQHQAHNKQLEVSIKPALAACPLAACPLAACPLAACPLAARPLAARPLAARPLAARPLAARPLAARPRLASSRPPPGRGSQAADNLIVQLRAEYGGLSTVIQDLQDEIQVQRNTLAKDQADLVAAQQVNASLTETVAQKAADLERHQAGLAQRRQQLETEASQTVSTERSAAEAEKARRADDEHLRAVDKELKELKEEMFRQSQVLFRSSQQKSNVIAEINGAEAALRNLQAKIHKLDGDAMKQRELIYQADYATQVLERKVAWAQGQRSDEEKAQLTDQIKELTEQLDRQTRDQAMLAQQARQATRDKEEMAVQHDVLKLEVRRLQEILNARQDEVFGLTNRRYQLQCTIEERTQEIQAHCDMLRAELKARPRPPGPRPPAPGPPAPGPLALPPSPVGFRGSRGCRVGAWRVQVLQEDHHRVSLELRERQVRVDKLRAKFEAIVGVRGGNPDEQAEHTQAFCIVQAAQQKQQLEKQGDELDGLIRQKMDEVRRLENTMRLLQAKNQEYRGSFHKADATSREFEQKEALDEQVKGAVDRARYKRREVGEVQQLIEFQQKTAADLEAERDLLLRNIQVPARVSARGVSARVRGCTQGLRASELDRRKQQLEREIEGQAPKLDRPTKQMAKMARDMRRARGLPEDQESPVERDFQLQELKETNQVVLASLVQLGKQYPEVGAFLQGLFEPAVWPRG
ncbi:putative flagella associated protein [Paratrimastix pyriformis]|uniref:Flagella associated protein n=1 Tax=Paratrimastix pyriformis TaxID=342808 RepID=A0ABQ8ULT4_9EUKA|nr:putative flagella associated protein [Paratrimastix pyriformis]